MVSITPSKVRPQRKLSKKRYLLGMSSIRQNESNRLKCNMYHMLLQAGYPKTALFLLFLGKVTPQQKNVKTQLQKDSSGQWIICFCRVRRGKDQNDAWYTWPKILVFRPFPTPLDETTGAILQTELLCISHVFIQINLTFRRDTSKKCLTASLTYWH